MAKKLNSVSFSFGGRKVQFTKSKTKAAVKYAQGAKPAVKRSNRSASAPLKDVHDFEVLSASRGIDAKLDSLRAQPDVSVGTHVWNVDGETETPLIPTGNIYIEFLADADPEKVKAILDELHLNITEVVGVGAYRVSTTNESPNPIKCAIQLQKSKIICIAEPEFLTKPAERNFTIPNGKYISTQWHLENSGRQIPIIDAPNAVFGNFHFKPGADAKVAAAWLQLQSLGSPYIKIAVIDTGFALDHPQLKGNGSKIRNPFNAANRNADVSPWVPLSGGRWTVASHGTSCAAVAAGALDSTGVLGAAPNALLIPIKLDVLSDEAIKAAFEHAFLNGADVISCSLGFPQPMPLSTYVSNYISKVAREGRGGKGIPIFIAAGNANQASGYQTRQVSDFAAHPDVLCITASNSLDLRSSYSFYGPNAHNCAPSNGDNGVGITTANVDPSADGRSLALGYTSSFGGTSSAAPLCAGICALLLSANPNLNVGQIRQIFRSTADRIGGDNAYNSAGHSDYYGYGRVNAYQAVSEALRLKQGSSAPSPGAGSSGTTGSTTQKGKVLSATLNVRQGPSTSYAKTATLKKGNEVDLIEKVGTWWRIGNQAFVSGDYIQVIASATASSSRKGKIISSILNVRAAPSVGASKVEVLKYGAIVPIYESTADGWHRIGTGKWVFAKYVQLV